MAVPKALGVHLLPSSGEWSYDTIPYTAAQYKFTTKQIGTPKPTNTFYAPGGSKTDYSYALDQLQAQHPETTTVSLVIAWFFDSEDASQCNIYPSTIFLLGDVWEVEDGNPVQSNWMCSGLTQADFPGLIPIPTNAAGNYVYGGTPSDPSVVRCIEDLKGRGFRVVFYPFLLGTCSGYPWRGRITCSPDMTAEAASAVAAFLGSAEPGMFSQDTTNLTVGYSGNLFDWTYRRMILHYANLCVIAGGVDVFVIGSELRGLETIRGATWTQAGTTDANGYAIWDYPFVAGLIQLSSDVRSVFDGAGLTRDTTNYHNLVVYSADWSSWMGWQHPGENGQWPHLDQLFASADIDLVSFDNYLPLTDWTTGGGGIDVVNWSAPAPSGSWPPSTATMSGLGLSGMPTIYSTPYIKANIEGGQYFSWFYNSGSGGGHGTAYGYDPNGSGLLVTLPTGDRLAQARNAYSANQQILANKQYRWWWSNTHQAVYDDGDGTGWSPHGPQTEWIPQSKPIIFLEYGFSSVDKATNQPNVFFDAKSSESATPFWSVWQTYGATTYPLRDDTIAVLALEAVYEYWNTDGHNETSAAGLPMIVTTFCCAWNWDARPFPIFPLDTTQWGDTGNWAQGDWFNGLRASLPPPEPSPDPSPGTYATLPATPTIGWSVHVKPRFATDVATMVSGREARRARYVAPFFDIELTYEFLRSDVDHEELQAIAGFFELMGGAATPFWFAAPLSLASNNTGLTDFNPDFSDDFGGSAPGQRIGLGDGATTTFSLVHTIGAATIPVYGTSGVSTVYLDGVSQTSGWSATGGYAPAIVFTTAPAANVAVSAEFAVLWLCRFSDDVQDFEEFMTMLWRLRTLKLQTVRP